MDIKESKILLKDFQKGKIEKDKLEHYRGSYKMGYFYTADIQEAIETVLSELEKKDKEIAELKADNSHQWEERCKLTFELEKKDKEYEELTEASKELCKTVNLMKKVKNEMAKHIHLSGDYECLNKECEDDGNIDCEECIKEYFKKKVEGK